MTVDHPLVDRIRADLADAANPARAASQQAYMKSTMPFRGVPVPTVRLLARQAAAGFDPDAETFDATIRTLWDQAGYREERYAATAIVRLPRLRDRHDPDTLGLYRHLITTGAWWDHVDELAHGVGDLLRLHPATVGPLMRRWAKDDDTWVRRAAILSQLQHGPDTDTALLAAVIEPNLDDRSFWLRKAIGWALRDYARTDADWVRERVDAWGDALSSLSHREALKHV